MSDMQAFHGTVHLLDGLKVGDEVVVYNPSTRNHRMALVEDVENTSLIIDGKQCPVELGIFTEGRLQARWVFTPAGFERFQKVCTARRGIKSLLDNVTEDEMIAVHALLVGAGVISK